MDKKNLAIVRQSFAQAVFTHQVQEAAANRNLVYVRRMKIINVAMTAAVLVLIILQASHPEFLLFSIFATCFSVAEIAFLIVQLTYSFDDKMLSHKSAALEYMALRDKYRLLITDIMNQKISIDMICDKRDILQAEYQQASNRSPITTSKDFDTAQLRLNKRGKVAGEQFTWSNEEIDRFLPEELRLSK